MQKWEYLYVTRHRGEDTNFISFVAYINDKDVWKERILFYQYVEKLHSQGWEVVSIEQEIYMFKRPKPLP